MESEDKQDPTEFIDPLGLHGEVIVDTSSIEKLWDLTRAAPLIMAAAIGTQVLPKDKVKTDDSPCTSGNCCPPCKPYPVGHPGFTGPKTVLTGIDRPVKDGGTGKVHYKKYVVKQDRRDCSCYWAIDNSMGHHVYIKPVGKDLNNHPNTNRAHSRLAYHEK